MRVNVIGLGEVGSSVLKEMMAKKPDFRYSGVDRDNKKFGSLRNVKYSTSPSMADVHIICAYSTEDVFDVLESIDYSNKPLVVVESTIMPGKEKEIEKIPKNIVFFPHRFNSNDRKHGVFNQKRVMGGPKDAVRKAIGFYKNFMNEKDIVITSPSIAVLSKAVENAYRFTEIAIAEELKMLCNKRGADFEELRRCCNTKWNIGIREARDGIGGKCLEKDMAMVNKYFGKNMIFSSAIEVDRRYKKNKKKVKK